MNKIKLCALLLAALALASALTLVFVARYRGGPVAGPAAVPAVRPAGPAVPVVKPKKPARRKPAAKAIASPVPEKPEKRRKKRVSRLQEPGEALGGGVQLDMPANKAGSPPGKK